MKQIKPYIFIIVFLAFPLLLVPFIRKANTNFLNTNNNLQSLSSPHGLLIHGGAGNIIKEHMSDSIQTLYTLTLEKALKHGYALIEKGDSAINVVPEVIKTLEDSPLFNAGKGSVFAANGQNEMDASIMNGKNLQAGAVAGVKKVKNPIMAAKAVMQHSNHVLLSGSGADDFAQKCGLKMENTSYFFTERQWIKHKQGLKQKEFKKHGTVGCVVLDKYGNLAAGTSTGGLTNKKYGRIGDSPIIGAGTYANNNTCAVSCTGHGEFFIRYSVAYALSARIALLNEPIEKAANYVINELEDIKGYGGLIAIDKQGNYSMLFNTPGMFRGVYTNQQKAQVKLFSK